MLRVWQLKWTQILKSILFKSIYIHFAKRFKKTFIVSLWPCITWLTPWEIKDAHFPCRTAEPFRLLLLSGEGKDFWCLLYSRSHMKSFVVQVVQCRPRKNPLPAKACKGCMTASLGLIFWLFLFAGFNLPWMMSLIPNLYFTPASYIYNCSVHVYFLFKLKAGLGSIINLLIFSNLGVLMNFFTRQFTEKKGKFSLSDRNYKEENRVSYKPLNIGPQEI